MKYALVNMAIASLRKEPLKISELVDEVLYGMKVEILEQVGNDWFYIRTHYNYLGFVHISELLFNDRTVQERNKTSKKVVIQPYADILSNPKIQSGYLISLTKGAIISISGSPDDNGWVKVFLYDGRIGYIKEKFICDYITTWNPTEEDRLRGGIVHAALSYLGTQYRWGGKTPLGIDCSGLCSMAYMLNGVIIYRDAKIIEGFPVQEIDFNAMKPADLLFFPGHVAMYIGNYRYIHSTGKNGSDGVVINSLDPKAPDYREDLPEKLIAVGSIF